jgi:segregation and condensation protein A
MDGIVADHIEARAGGGQGAPFLDLDGFSGPLDQLLALARAHEIDLTRVPLVALIEQLAAALHHAPPAMPLGQKGGWVVMTAWLVELRSRLLLPADPAVQLQAEAQAVELRDRLVDLQTMQALAQWLDARPQLGRDVFARGRPEDIAAAIGAGHDRDPIEHVRWEPVDVVEFLWASLALFDEAEDAVDTAAVYRPRRWDWYSVAAARARILAVLADAPEGERFERLLPDLPDESIDGERTAADARRGLAWGCTFVASLELAKQGDVTLAQEGLFAPIHVSPPAALAPA